MTQIIYISYKLTIFFNYLKVFRYGNIYCMAALAMRVRLVFDSEYLYQIYMAIFVPHASSKT